MTLQAHGQTAVSVRSKPDEIDFTRAILPQVDSLDGGYWDWVHAPVSPKLAKQLREGSSAKWAGSLRIFRSDFLESLSHIPWWLVLVVWLPIVGALLVAAVSPMELSPLKALGWAAFGVFAWTLTEYSLHRFIFHYRVRTAFGRRLHFLAHGIHHLDPWDGTRLVFPPVPGMLIALTIFGGFRLALPLPSALATMAGFLVGYIAYDMIHYFTHHAKPMGAVGKYLKRYHLAHHHREAHRLFGVSNPLWDIVFRTGA